MSKWTWFGLAAWPLHFHCFASQNLMFQIWVWSDYRARSVGRSGLFASFSHWRQFLTDWPSGFISPKYIFGATTFSFICSNIPNTHTHDSIFQCLSRPRHAFFNYGGLPKPSSSTFIFSFIWPPACLQIVCFKVGEFILHLITRLNVLIRVVWRYLILITDLRQKIWY